MGARIREIIETSMNGEPSGNIDVKGTTLHGTEIQGAEIPNVIDEIPVLAVLGTQLQGGLRVSGAAELRKKESDRIHSTVTNLNQIGIDVEEYPDSFFIPPGQKVRGGRIRTFGDHRIAMAFAIAGLISSDGVELDDPACADVSFP